MGRELVIRAPAVETKPHRSFAEEFERQFPFYLSIGMTYDQYWRGDCRMTAYYRAAYRLQKERRNQELWLQGAYFYEALVDVAPILHAFAGKGTEPRPYLEEPLPLSSSDVEKHRARGRRRAKEVLKAKMDTWVAETNSKFSNKEAASDG